MKLYHGSPVPGITRLIPFLTGPDHPVCLTHSADLAVIYAHNPLTRPLGWFPYYWDKEGNLHYEEYYPDAMAEIYKEQSGYVYTCEGDFSFPQLDKMPWIYLSNDPVAVSECRFIPDIYEELLALEQTGRLTVHRYETLTERELAGIRRMTEREIETMGLRENLDSEYARFIHAHYPDLL